METTVAEDTFSDDKIVRPLTAAEVLENTISGVIYPSIVKLTTSREAF